MSGYDSFYSTVEKPECAIPWDENFDEIAAEILLQNGANADVTEGTDPCKQGVYVGMRPVTA
jgi:hypothetical protein